jgi:sulfatase modifying factor 1
MREGALSRSRASRAASVLALVAGTAGCRTETPVGGLLVTMNLEPSLRAADLTRLTVDVGSFDGGTTYRDAGYPIGDASTPGDVRFPTSFGVASNGDPYAAVSMALGVWRGTQPIDVERYTVTNVPTTKVVELPVVFGSSCSASAILDGGAGSCPLETGGWCEWESDHWACDADRLPPAGFDAGAFPEGNGDAAADATVAAHGAGDAYAGDSTLEDAENVEVDAEAGGDAEGGADAEGGVEAPLNIPCDAPCGPGEQCVDGACVPVPPSCSGGGPGAGPNCGLAGTDDCCASDEVRGGSFFVGYDGREDFDMSFPASVSQFRLDRYEVTVGRFREFINATVAGDASPAWVPAPASGKHSHLNGEAGLSNGGDDDAATFESGWDPSWDAYLPQTQADWDTQLLGPVCTTDSGPPNNDWTPTAGARENLPINCVTWYEAYAFCIWDNGFLPSMVEWDYAAAGGPQQNEYAWGNTAPGYNAHFAIYNCYYPPQPKGYLCQGVANIAPVGSAYEGQAVWGQFDLTGNLFEYNLDFGSAEYPLPCVDCAATAPGSGDQRSFVGGDFLSVVTQLPSSKGLQSPPENPHDIVGIRCARVP